MVSSFNQRSIELINEIIYETPKGEQHLREGWLLNGYDEYEQEFRVHLFRQAIRNGEDIVLACPLHGDLAH
jgi:hypothetical protein